MKNYHKSNDSVWKRLAVAFALHPIQWIFTMFVVGLFVGIAVDKQLYQLNGSSKLTSNNLVSLPTSTGTNQMRSLNEFGYLDIIEETYESTLRSCLGVRCFNQPVTQNGQDLIRVGFLYFPNSGAELLFELLNPFFINGKNAQIEVVPDTHVPAYGYGKNHGWSSIVRVARRPIHHAYSLVQNAHLETSPESMECQLRQVVTWQCRLSHVAAHTRMLTGVFGVAQSESYTRLMWLRTVYCNIFLDQLFARPQVELEKILTFVGTGVDYDRTSLIALSKDLPVKLVAYLDHETSAQKWSTLDKAQLLTVPEGIYDLGLRALQRELDSTNTLSDWPCKSFLKNKCSPKLQVQPEMIAANCSAPFVKCSVRFDTRGG